MIEAVSPPKKFTVAFAGNPNCGKTTLFNDLTGSELKTGNWPGVTVEKKTGDINILGHDISLVDLPGIYSLDSYTLEESVSRRFILGEDGDTADVIVNIADASVLERSLYLTTQLIETGTPVILALNMMDVVQKRGMVIDTMRLSKRLGITVVPVSARNKNGLDTLMRDVVKLSESTNDAGDIKPKRKYSQVFPSDSGERYVLIERLIRECIQKSGSSGAFTDRIDKLLTHPYLGLPIFFMVMAAVFSLTFTFGDMLAGMFERGLDFISNAAGTAMERVGVSWWLISLITDGIITGVGGVLTFLPNIFILFTALALLEDSGYMARAAYVTDSIMSRIGLSGRAFIPMILGLGCTVPAIMATRTLESNRDRFRTMLALPFMSCSARLPVYVLLSGMFFGEHAALISFSMYILGFVAAVVSAKATDKIFAKKDDSSGAGLMLIELPEYKLPSFSTVFHSIMDKIKEFLTKAGTTIFLASVVLWFIMNFGPGGMTDSPADSFAAVIGRFIAPVLSPAGLGVWQIAVALICGIAAKELVISGLCMLYGGVNPASAAGRTALAVSLGAEGFGALNAYSMMIFVLLYVPCAATAAAMKTEMRSGLKALAAAAVQLLTAYSASLIFYQIFSRL